MKGRLLTVAAGLLSLLALQAGGTGAATGQPLSHRFVPGSPADVGHFRYHAERGAWNLDCRGRVPGLREVELARRAQRRAAAPRSWNSLRAIRPAGRGARGARRGAWPCERLVCTPCRLRHLERGGEAARHYQAQGSPKRHLRLEGVQSHPGTTRNPHARLGHAEFCMARIALLNHPECLQKRTPNECGRKPFL